jgi:hypothetical protein
MDLDTIKELRKELILAVGDEARSVILDRHPKVKTEWNHPFFYELSIEFAVVLKQLLAIEQWAPLPFQHRGELETLLAPLVPVDRFYLEIGWIVGYQCEILERIAPKPTQEGPILRSRAVYHPPVFDDISEDSEETREAIRWGLEALPFMAELYALGGAADRLHLLDPKTNTELPAAKLPFMGRTLLEGLIRDLQAREWLYFRLFGTQIITPVAMMTSWEKNNHQHVMKICEEMHWFGRPRDAFRFFVQPLVPTVDEEGRWHGLGTLQWLLKPGGHGAIWKLAKDEGIFAWLAALQKTKALVRQINNPMAGIDGGLFAFTGIGWKRDHWFGFASCPRLVKASEGMNVIVETPDGKMVLTNIEYCDFTKFGIEDCPLQEGAAYSKFSSNTNILFIDLAALLKAVEANPLPGLLIHFKKGVFPVASGEKKEFSVARLESTMQNIADVFKEPKPVEGALRTQKTFVTHNHRHKTISVAKKAYQSALAMQETPELCFYDRMRSARELLVECGFQMPPSFSPEEESTKGPSTHFVYHPALGPLYSIIRQKLRRGSLAPGAEFHAEIAELDVEELHLKGSLQVQAERVLGSREPELLYSDRVGRCRLKNVRVENRGVDWSQSAPFWKMELVRFETLRIELKGYSEFDAEGVVFQGAHHFVVEEGMRMVVREKEGRWVSWLEPIEETPLWRYEWAGSAIRLV